MKRIRQVLLALIVVAAVSALFIAGSIVADSWLGRGRVASLTNASIPNTGGPEVLAYVARPEQAGMYPAVIMIHEFWGINEEIVEKADALAQEGYVVVAPDTFRGGSTTWLPRAIYQTITTPVSQTVTDLDAVYEWISLQPDVQPPKVAIMGFCYGGRTALQYSLTNDRLAATAIFYGSLVTDPEQLRGLSGPVLGIFGEADNSIPLDEVEAFESGLAEAGIPHEITVYDDQPHAFVTNMAAVRAGGAPGEAWAQLLGFLEGALSGESTLQSSQASASPLGGADWRYVLMLVYEHTIGSGRSDHAH